MVGGLVRQDSNHSNVSRTYYLRKWQEMWLALTIFQKRKRARPGSDSSPYHTASSGPACPGLHLCLAICSWSSFRSWVLTKTHSWAFQVQGSLVFQFPLFSLRLSSARALPHLLLTTYGPSGPVLQLRTLVPEAQLRKGPQPAYLLPFLGPRRPALTTPALRASLWVRQGKLQGTHSTSIIKGALVTS